MKNTKNGHYIGRAIARVSSWNSCACVTFDFVESTLDSESKIFLCMSEPYAEYFYFFQFVCFVDETHSK